MTGNVRTHSETRHHHIIPRNVILFEKKQRMHVNVNFVIIFENDVEKYGNKKKI